MSFGVGVDALFSKMCNHTENGTAKSRIIGYYYTGDDCSRDSVRKNSQQR